MHTYKLIKENVNKLNKLGKDKNKKIQYHQQKQMIRHDS